MKKRITAIAIIALFAAACEPTVPEGRFACAADDDCPAPMVCRTNVDRCFLTQLDAGPPVDAD